MTNGHFFTQDQFQKYIKTSPASQFLLYSNILHSESDQIRVRTDLYPKRYPNPAKITSIRNILFTDQEQSLIHLPIKRCHTGSGIFEKRD